MVDWNSFVNNQSIKVRFFTTLLVNISKTGLSLITGIIIARGLGPADYGNFIFLLGSFVSIATLFDMGTSSAFYTFLSQRKYGLKFYWYYFLWISIQLILTLSLIAFIFPVTWRNKIWLGHTKELIILAFLASFMMNKIWQTATRIGESIRATVIVQLHNIILTSLYLVSIFAMVILHRLTIVNLFSSIIFIYLIFTFILAKRLKDNLTATKEEELSDIFRRFKVYCIPLVVYGVVSFGYSFADYWFLQKFGGAVQQGFYAVGFKFAAVSLIATTSILSVFWKEIAEANSLGNMERVRMLYHKISRSLYFLGAASSCLLIPFSRELLSLFLGPSYQSAWLPLSIMFLYPVHQSLGQVTGIMFRATEQTKIHSKIGIFFMAISIPATYFFLAPKSSFIPGLHLGAVGLAIKMVACQLVAVNLMTFFIARYIKIPFNWTHQINVLLLLLPMGFLSKVCAQQALSLLSLSNYSILVMAIAGILYSGGIILLLYKFPPIAGIDRDQINHSLVWLRKRFRPS